jgi:hypothetical protein
MSPGKEKAVAIHQPPHCIPLLDGLRAISIFASSKCWYRYRKHPDSACAVAVKTGQYHHVRVAFLDWAEEYLSKETIKDNEVWQALRKELIPIPLNACAPCSKAHSKTLEGHCKLHSYFSDLV